MLGGVSKAWNCRLAVACVKCQHPILLARRLVEELLPFMEMSFDDPKAASLASKSHRAPLARRAGASSGSLVRGVSCSICYGHTVHWML